MDSTTMTSTSTTDATPTVSSVDGKLPPFWTTHPALWFIQVEAQFAARRITADLTKYHYVVSSLPPPIASEIRDLLLDPPAGKAYATLKEILTHRVTPPESQRVQQQLRDTDLGDCTPSQLLRYMQLLRGETTNTVDGALIRELFLQKLPSSVRLVVAESEQKDLPAFAELANRLMAITAPTSLAAVRAQHAQDELQQMREDIVRLTESLSALHTSRNAQNLSEPNTSLSQPQRENICWYYRRFGNAARNCVPPCARSGNDSGKH